MTLSFDVGQIHIDSHIALEFLLNSSVPESEPGIGIGPTATAPSLS
jgi:hypothetical protein